MEYFNHSFLYFIIFDYKNIKLFLLIKYRKGFVRFQHKYTTIITFAFFFGKEERKRVNPEEVKCIRLTDTMPFKIGKKNVLILTYQKRFERMATKYV